MQFNLRANEVRRGLRVRGGACTTTVAKCADDVERL